MQNRRQGLAAAGLLVAGGLVPPVFAQKSSSPTSLAERFATTLSAHDIMVSLRFSLTATSIAKSVLLHHRRLRMLPQSKALSHFSRRD